MYRTLAVCLLLAAVTLVGAFANLAAERDAPVGLDRRVPWTTSHVKGAPEPPHPSFLERVFSDLTFDEPLELAFVPGTNRWVVAERKGKIWTFAADPKTSRKDLLIDLGKTVYGVVMHPQFAK